MSGNQTQPNPNEGGRYMKEGGEIVKIEDATIEVANPKPIPADSPLHPSHPEYQPPAE